MNKVLGTIKLEKLTKQDPFTLLIYGDSNTGKTTVAGSVIGNPFFEKCVILDLENNLAPIADKEVERIAIGSYNQVAALRDILMLPSEQRPEGFEEIKTVIIDSLTALTLLVQREIAKEGVDRNERNRVDEYDTQLQDYSRTKNIITKLIHDLRAANVNLIVTASENVSDVLGAPIEINLFAKLRAEIKVMFSRIWYTKEDNTGGRAIKVLRRGSKDIFVKTKGDWFVKELEKVCTDNGYFVIPDAQFDTIPHLHRLYTGETT